jgi:ribonuclease T2
MLATAGVCAPVDDSKFSEAQLQLGSTSSKLKKMKKVSSPILLLGVALIACGCQPAPPPQRAESSHTESASRPAESDGGRSRSASEDEYNRTYQDESEHRHHHDRRQQGNRDRASSDNGAGYDRDSRDGYDRAETDDRSGGNAGAYQPRQGDSRGMSGGGGSMRSNGHHNSRALTAAPGQFDFYVLNLSWSPEFCHGHPTAAECAEHRAFTLHGLWPQNNDGTYPEDCSDAPGPARPSQYADIYPDAGLLQHEWQTHGSCSGLTADQFFARARQAEQAIRIPAELSHLTQQTMMTPTQINALFAQNNPGIPAGALAISCGNNYLTAVEVCLDKNLKPESCSSVKTCGANQVRIPAPQ